MWDKYEIDGFDCWVKFFTYTVEIKWRNEENAYKHSMSLDHFKKIAKPKYI